MASNIKFKRSAVQNRVPTTAQLDLGELALNTYDGKLYTEINTGSAAVVEIGSKLSSLVVDGDNGGGGGDVVFHGTTAGKDLTWDYSDNQLEFANDVKAEFGAFGQLEIHFESNSGNSVIKHTSNLGNLVLHSDNLDLRPKTNVGHVYLRANYNSSVTLYHANSVRVTTTADGADISGTGSLKLPVGTTAQRNSSPAAGDIRYNSTLGSFEGYSSSWGELGGGGIGIGSTAVNPASGLVTNRIGVGFTDINVVGTGISVTGYGSTIVLDFNDFKPGTFNRSIHNYTATAGQTTFAGLAYDNAERQIAVYLNGARLSADTYTATSGTTVVLDVGASVGDEVEIINININSDVDRNVNTYTATAGQTTFTGLSYNSITELDVYLNGIRLATGDFTATTGNTVVLNVGASVNDIVDIVSTGDGVSFRSTADTSGDKFTLTNVGIGTDITPDKLNVRGNVNIVGVLTATTLHGDGSNLTNTGSTLSQPSTGTQRIVTTSLTTGTMTSSGTGSELAFDYANNHLEFSDSTRATFGTDNDLQQYHDGSNAYFLNATGDVLFKHGSETLVAMQDDGEVQLYHDGTQRLRTTSAGVIVTGDAAVSANISCVNLNPTGFLQIDDSSSGGNLYIGNNSDLKIFHNGSTNFIRSGAGGHTINIDNNSGVVGAKFIPAGAVELYHNGSKKFETTSTGASITGNLSVSGVLTYDDVTSVDSVGIITARQGVRVTADGGNTTNYISVGAGNDFKLFHDGSNTYLKNDTGDLFLKSSSADYIRGVSSTGAVELKYGNNKKFETNAAGILVTGNITAGDSQQLQLGANGDLRAFHDGTNSFIDNNMGDLYIQTTSSGDDILIESADDFTVKVAGSETAIEAIGDGTVKLYHNGTQKLQTDSTGTIFYDDTFLGDNLKANFGASADLQIYHDGTDSFIKQSTGTRLKIQGVGSNGADVHIQARPDEEGIKLLNNTGNSYVELYYNGAKKFETTSTGVKLRSGLASSGGMANMLQLDNTGNNSGDGSTISFSRAGTIRAELQVIKNETANNETDFVFRTTDSGSVFEALRIVGDNGNLQMNNDSVFLQIGAGQDLDLHHNGTNSYIRNKTGNLHIRPLVNEEGIILKPNGAVELYHNNLKRFETSADGCIFSGPTNTTASVQIVGTEARSAEIRLIADDGDDFTDTVRLHQSINGNFYLQNLTASATFESMLVAIPNGAVELYHDNSKKFETTSSGATVTGGIYPAATNTYQLGGSSLRWNELNIKSVIDVSDNGKIRMGDSDDLQIYHNGSHSYIDNKTGNLYIRANTDTDVGGDIHIRAKAGENSISCLDDGAVQLYHDNTLRLETRSNDVKFYDALVAIDNAQIQLGNSGDLKLYHDGTNSYVDNTVTGILRIRGNNGAGVELHPKGGQYGLRTIPDGAVELYHNGTKKFETSSSGVTLSGDLFGGDNIVIRLGSHTTSGNIQLYHNSSNSYFDNNATGHIYIRNNVNTDFGGNIYIQPKSGESSITAIHDGAVELYHNNSKRFETTANGLRTEGELIYLGPNNITNFIHSGGNISLTADSNMFFVADCNDTSGAAPSGEFIFGGGSNTNTDSNQDFTTSEFGNGGQPRNPYAILDENSFRPASNGGIDLGTNSLRFGNVFTQDLNLSNEGNSNDVDGTWGSYTIQEGEDDLFLINKRSGKKYKFNLTEVS